MNSQKFIDDPESVRLSRIGELKIDGKPVLNLANDMKSASRQVFRERDPPGEQRADEPRRCRKAALC
jgi:hypothetical protein